MDEFYEGLRVRVLKNGVDVPPGLRGTVRKSYGDGDLVLVQVDGDTWPLYEPAELESLVLRGRRG